MPTRERPGDRGRRLTRASMRRVAADLRSARVAAGLSLREVAGAVGVSHTQIARLEGDRLRAPDPAFVGACCAVVGLELAIRTYPGGDPLRDRAHAALLSRLVNVLHPGLTWRTEVPLPIERDLRAWDAQIQGRGWRACVEAETRIADGQALERRLSLKHRDGGGGLLILLVADTRTNRHALLTIRPALRDLLPLDGRPILAALRSGREPPGSGIVVL